MTILLANLNIQPTFSDSQDWDLPGGGHFYTQTGGGGNLGYAVTNNDGIGFWNEFKRLGGVSAVGYPVSQRFMLNGFMCQAMQRVVFQWQPQTNTVSFLNVFDLAQQAGKDDWLKTVRQVPPPVAADFDAGLDWNGTVKKRLALLDANPAIKQRYNSVVGDPIQMNGLPTSQITDMGNNYTLRCQRVVIQQWKQDVPWAKKGDVTVANGGDIAKELQLYSPSANQAAPAPGQTATTPTTTTAASACTLPADAVKIEKKELSAGGAMTVQGTIRNTCNAPQNLMIDWMSVTADGKPLMDGRTMTVQNLAPGASKPFTAVVPGSRTATDVQVSFSSFGNDFVCLDVGTSKCLKTDPWLISAINKLKQNQWGYWLLRVAAENDVKLEYASLPPSALGWYKPLPNTITLNKSLDNYSSWIRATVLAHELQHAVDKASGKNMQTTAGCYQTEESAYRREAEVWLSFWSTRLPEDIDGLHSELNDVTLAAAANPEEFRKAVEEIYREECGE
jgi:hypothetical protein